MLRSTQVSRGRSFIGSQVIIMKSTQQLVFIVIDSYEVGGILDASLPFNTPKQRLNFLQLIPNSVLHEKCDIHTKYRKFPPLTWDKIGGWTFAWSFCILPYCYWAECRNTMQTCILPYCYWAECRKNMHRSNRCEGREPVCVDSSYTVQLSFIVSMTSCIHGNHAVHSDHCQCQPSYVYSMHWSDPVYGSDHLTYWSGRWCKLKSCMISGIFLSKYLAIANVIIIAIFFQINDEICSEAIQLISESPKIFSLFSSSLN